MNDPIDACARELAEARLRGIPLQNLPISLRPRNLDDAYAVQRGAIRLWNDELAGWKVGATSTEIQSLFGISEPVYGPVFRNSVLQSPARVSAAAFAHRMLETEFSFRFGEDLPSRRKRYTQDDIVAAVDALLPSIEIICPRFTTLTVDQIPQLVADYCANGGAVLGRPCTDWRNIDLPSHAVRISIDGKVVQEGTGGHVLENPLNALVWLVNAISDQGLSIETGQIVMTGTMTGIHAPAPGERAVADFGDLGSVEIVFEA